MKNFLQMSYPYFIHKQIYIQIDLDMSRTYDHKEVEQDKRETFNTLNQQLQAEKQALLRERQQLQQNGNYQQSRVQHSRRAQLDRSGAYTDRPGSSLATSQIRKDQLKNRSRLIKNKIEEIIQLCGGETQNTIGYREVVEAQQNILAYLDTISSESKTSPAKNRASRKKKPQQQTPFEDFPNQNYKKLIGDDAMQMIEEIERKALIEIQFLRADKVNLMRKLNQEIKAHNEEKRIRLMLEKKLNQMVYNGRTMQENRGKKYHSTVGELIEELEEQSPNFSKQNMSRNDAFRRNQSYVRERQLFEIQKSSTPTSRIINQTGRRPATSIPQQSSTFYIEQEISRLENENRKLRENLSPGMRQEQNVKSHLKNQLSQLSTKINNYQNMISNQNRSEAMRHGQIDELMLQGDSLAADGNRLMRNKNKNKPHSPISDLQFGQSISTQQYRRQYKFLQRRIQDLQRQNSSLNHQERNGSDPDLPQFAGSQYEAYKREERREAYC